MLKPLHKNVILKKEEVDVYKRQDFKGGVFFMKTYIGVDLGGTNVRVAKVDEEGNILQIVKEPTEVAQGTKHVINKIISMIEKIDGYADCEGIGMGVPGPVNTIEGKMVLATNLPGFEGFPIAKTISDHFQMPTFVDNDAVSYTHLPFDCGSKHWKDMV